MANDDWIAELLGLPNVQVTHYQMVGDYQLNLFVEPVAWREPGLAYTVRYEQHVDERARREPTQRVAQDEHLTEEIVQGIFARWARKD
jgi:hypothetical protein